jgi:hypothetical protein
VSQEVKNFSKVSAESRAKMSEKPQTEFQSSIEATGKVTKRTMTLKFPRIAETINGALGISSVFWWIWMILWFELTAIIFMGFVFVSVLLFFIV